MREAETFLSCANRALLPSGGAPGRDQTHERHTIPRCADRGHTGHELLELPRGSDRRALLRGVRKSAAAASGRELFCVFRIAAEADDRTSLARRPVPHAQLEAAPG